MHNMETDTFLDLIRLVSYIQSQHQKASCSWIKTHENSVLYNMKNIYMCDIAANEGFMQHIREYLDFCSTLAPTFDLSSPVIHRSRVKQLNSVQMKIDKYSHGAEGGKSPVAKGLNDLFGIRYIHDGHWTKEEISEQLKANGYTLKCLDAHKEVGYKATHIYFHHNNITFDWELQVWNKEDEKQNIELHTRYKQDYKFWESEQKGGAIQ